MDSKSTNNKKISCSKASQCGGCAFINEKYEASLAKKQELANSLFSKLCNSVKPIVGAENPYFYRNKVHAAFAGSGKNIICGTYAEGTHKVIDTSNCLIENKKATEIINYIKELAVSFKVRIYDENRRQGLLRRVLIRTADSTGEILVVLVITDPVFPGKKDFIKKLVTKYPEIKSVVFNINKRSDSMILGDKNIPAYGYGNITDVLCGMKFRISPESFYQINHAQCERLYTLAIEGAKIKNTDKVLDAYCGIGTIGLIASKSAGEVVGVELNSKAVSDAKANAKLNNVTNARFIGGDATEFIMQAAKAKEHFDVIILDPPRAGTTPEFVNACEKLSPDRIVYVSCNPETLARDLKLFKKAGYKADSVTPVDMFPFTNVNHVESVAILQK